LVSHPDWQPVQDQAISVAERSFIAAILRLVSGADEPVSLPVVGYESESGTPVDFAWPDRNIAVFLDLEHDDPRIADLGRDWRVFGDDPDAIFAALKEAA
jgi:hypothetical protein